MMGLQANPLNSTMREAVCFLQVLICQTWSSRLHQQLMNTQPALGTPEITTHRKSSYPPIPNNPAAIPYNMETHLLYKQDVCLLWEERRVPPLGGEESASSGGRGECNNQWCALYTRMASAALGLVAVVTLTWDTATARGWDLE